MRLKDRTAVVTGAGSGGRGRECDFMTGLRQLARATDGITAKVFSMLNELAVEAVRSRKEQISDEDVESWKPALEREAVFA
jgi:hypothetical protein